MINFSTISFKAQPINKNCVQQPISAPKLSPLKHDTVSFSGEVCPELLKILKNNTLTDGIELWNAMMRKKILKTEENIKALANRYNDPESEKSTKINIAESLLEHWKIDVEKIKN